MRRLLQSSLRKNEDKSKAEAVVGLFRKRGKHGTGTGVCMSGSEDGHSIACLGLHMSGHLTWRGLIRHQLKRNKKKCSFLLEDKKVYKLI